MVKEWIEEHESVIKSLMAQEEKIKQLADLMVKTLKSGNKILCMGNGGSAADAQHLSAEIVGRYKLERSAWPAIALNTDMSIITSVGNDYDFEQIFARQIEGLAVKGDLVIGLSTSGNSKNIIAGIVKATKKGCISYCLTGKDGGELKKLSHHSIVVNSQNTPRIQEAHGLIIHMICEIVEKAMLHE